MNEMAAATTTADQLIPVVSSIKRVSPCICLLFAPSHAGPDYMDTSWISATSMLPSPMIGQALASSIA